MAPDRAVRNGSIFVEKWDELAAKSFTVWRGSVDTPFRQLQGVRLRSAPCVSPDGRWLAYIDSPQPAIVVRRISPVRDEVGAARSIGRLPLRKSDYAGCAWSPGGHAIVIVGSGDVGRRYITAVWRIQGDGTDLRELLRLKNAIGGPAPGDPTWSRRGRIAFVETTSSGSAWIAMADADGTNPSRLRRGHSPAWSPDGRRLTFIGSIGSDYETIAPGPVMVANADGDDVRRLRRKRSSAVAFSPDGRSLAITGWAFPDEGGFYDLITITDSDGTAAQTIRLPATPRGGVSTGVTWTRAA